MADKTISIEQILTFAVFGTFNRITESLSDTIEFVETIHTKPIRLVIKDIIKFNQTYATKYGNRNVFLNQTLLFQQVGGTKDLNISLYENIFFTQYAQPRPTLSQSLIFSENIQHFKGGDLADLLTFTETRSYKLVRIFIFNDTLIFTHYIPFYKNNVHFINPGIPPAYIPSFTVPIPIKIPPTDPLINPTITLPNIPYKKQYITLTLGNNSIKISAPEIGDSYKLEDTRIFRNTRNGDLLLYSDPIWPKIQTFNYRFSFLTITEIQLLKSFIKKTIGSTITLLDYENNNWQVIITTTELEYEQTGKNNYTTNIELQGNRA